MASQSAMGSGMVRGGGGGLLGGVGSTVGAVSPTGANLGNPATGALSSNASGVIGMPGMALNAAASTNNNASVISSTTQNVHLQSGTQMLLRVQ